MQSIPPCRKYKDRQNTLAIVVTTAPLFDKFSFTKISMSFFGMDTNGDTAPLKNASFSSARTFLGITSINNANNKRETYMIIC